MQTYVVKKGDTMTSIAKAYKISLQTLCNANPKITNINKIQVGQKINVPVPPTKKTTTVTKSTEPPKKKDTKNNTNKTNSSSKSMAGSARIKGMFDNVPFSFNPEEITDDKGNEFVFTDTSNGYYPILHHKGGRTPTIQFTLYINDREDVEGATQRMISKLNAHIPPETYSMYKGKPPESMIFSFGRQYVKRVWLEDFKVNRTQFNPELKTIEASISVSLLIHTGW